MVGTYRNDGNLVVNLNFNSGSPPADPEPASRRGPLRRSGTLRGSEEAKGLQ